MVKKRDDAASAYLDALENPRPRIGTTKPKRASTATGKAPTKRLVKRRKANTEPGYFPNPAPKKVACRAKILAEYRLGINAIAKERDTLSKQAALSYVQGIIMAGHICEVLEEIESHQMREALREFTK